MKRFLIVVLVVCLFCISCDNGQTVKDEIYMSFTDDAGKQICLGSKPQKTAVLFSSHAQMVLLSGGNVDITVGESIERGFVGEDTILVDSGAGKSINTEILIANSPDLVIGSYDIASHRQASQLLNDAGIPTALFRVESFSDYERVMAILCDIYGGQEYYNENVASVKEGIDKVMSSLPEGEQKKILFVRCASSSKATKAKTKQDNFVCAMLEELGTYNIAENAPILLDGLSIEEIIAQNPDYIFFSTMGDRDAAIEYMTSQLQNDKWQSLSAVKTGNYTFLDKEMFQYKPNNRWDDAYRILAELLYGKDE